jgi:CRP/FNR family cyclic AMP-dependent transcriptional regulator
VAVDDLSVLRTIPLFQSLGEGQLALVGAALHRRTFATGVNVLTVEQPGDVVYIVVSGTLKIHVEQSGGRDVILAFLGAGDTLGEMSVIDQVGRSANATTTETSTLLWLTRASFEEFLQTMPEFSANVLHLLVRRLRLADAHIQTLCTLDVPGRVARQLLALADRYGQTCPDGALIIPLRLTQSDFAELIGASRERVNQVMVDLRRRGYVGIGADNRIRVIDREALARRCR